MYGKFLLLALLAVCQGNVIKNSEPFEECSECPLDKHYLLPHEYDCTKFYYCEYGVRWTTPRDCAPGTEFSFELQVCIHPSIANCGLPGPSTTTSSSTTTSTTPSTTTTTEDPCETEAPCDEDGRLPNGCPVCPDVHLLLPAEDCGQFYYCAHGDKVITDCPAGLHFNPVLQVCDWPQVAGCEPTSPPCTPESGSNCGESTTTTTTSTTSSTTTSTSTTPSTTTTTEEPCETEAPCDEDARLPNGCPVCPDVHLLLPAEDCGQFYYCAHGDKVITDCPAGLHFNPVLQVCDWPQVAGCEPTIPPCTPESGSNCGESTTTTTTGTTPSTTTTTSTTTEEPCETDPPCDEDARLPNGCPVCPDVHLLLPAEDCGQFYYCAHGDKVITDCPAGLHFNPVLQVCDWPQVAGCEPTSPPCTPESDNNCGESTTTTTTTSTTPSTTTSTSTTPSTTTTTSTTPSTTTTTEEPCETEAPCDEDGRLPNGCPVCPDVHLLLPAEDCGQFYYCVHGDKVITDCPAGLHFNPVLQVCDWPQVAGCEPTSPPCTPESGNNCGENTTTTTTTSTTPSTTTTTSTTPSTTTTTEEPCETDPPCDEDAKLPNGCPVCPDVHLLLPAEDCGQFYYCVHGDKVITDCPAGLHFNPVLQVCDWPQVAGCEPTSPPCTPESGGNCGESTTTTTTTTTPSTTTTASTTTTSSTTPSTTTTTSTTPSTTTTTSTTPSTTTTTEEPCETEAPCDEDGRLPNGCPVCPDVHLLLPAEDCGQFYYCVHGDKVITDCPAGLHFNPVLQVCDWPQVAGCEPTSPPCTPESGGNCGEDSTTTTTTSTTPSTTTTTSTTPSTTPSTTTTTEEPCETEAPCDEDGRLPNGCPVCPDVHLLLPAEDCSQFYYCVHGDKVITDCPAGLHFNPVLQVCDWPQVAGCEPTIPPCTPESGGNCGENTTTTTTTSTTPSTTTTTSTTPSTTTTTEEPCETEAPCDEDGRLPNGCPVCPDLHLLLPAEDCGQFYYCVHGDKVITDCPAGLHFNPVLQVCDWPQVAGCEPTIPPCTPESGGNCGENTTSTTPSTTTITSTTPSTTTTTEEPCETEAPCDEDARLPNGCPVCPDVHLLLPAEDCSQFYYCAHGDKVITDCPAGLHFNPVLQVCDWPQVAGCEPTIPPCTPESGSNCGENTTTTTTTSTTPSTTTTTSTTPSTTTTTEEPCETEAPCDEDGRLPNGCPVCPDLHLLLPAEDCGQFYYCVHGDKVITDCPAGLHFNPVLQVCDWPQVAGCEPTIPPCTPESGGNCGENTTTTTTTSTTPSTTTTTSTTPSTTTTTEEPCETEAPCDEDGRLPNGCPVCPDVHLLLPAEDCGQFYYCAHGDKVITDCPAGLHFNPVLQVCDWPQVAGCEPTSPPCTPESGSNCGESTTTTTTSTTPSTTTTTSTTPSTTTTTEDPCETEAPCDENARLPNGCPVCPDVDLLLPAENCGQFYYCVHGDKVITDCPAGLHFSSALQVCDWPQTAGCEPTRPPCTTTTTSGNCV